MLNTVSESIHVFGNGTTSTIAVAAAIANRPVSLYGLVVTANSATVIIVQDTSGVALSEAFPLGGNKALILDIPDNGDPIFTTVAGRGIQLAQFGSANVGFDAYYQGGPMPVVPWQPPLTGGGGGGGGTAAGLAPMLSAARAGVGAVVVVGDGSGNARIISNIGAVT